MDVIPGRFPVAEAANVFDRNECLGLVTENAADELVLAFDFGRLIRRVIEHEAVHVAEDIVADPTHDFQVSVSEHRGKDALEQCFPRFAVLACVARLPLNCKVLDGGGRCAERRRKVYERHAEIECGNSVERAGGQRGGGAVLDVLRQAIPAIRQRKRFDYGLGRGNVYNDDTAKATVALECSEVGLEPFNSVAGRLSGESTYLVAG